MSTHISIEGSIGSGKSTLCDLIKGKMGGIATIEKQRVHEWTILGEFYSNSKDHAYSLQTQICDSYENQWREYKSIRREGGIYFSTLPEESEHASIITLHTKGSSTESVATRMTVERARSLALRASEGYSAPHRHVFFEGILSAHNVFSNVNHKRGDISDEHKEILDAKYDVVKNGFMPHAVFWLNPKKVATLQDRIRDRNRSFESGIGDDYLSDISAAYHTYLLDVFVPSYGVPVMEIDNSNLSAEETCDLIIDLLSSIQ